MRAHRPLVMFFFSFPLKVLFARRNATILHKVEQPHAKLPKNIAEGKFIISSVRVNLINLLLVFPKPKIPRLHIASRGSTCAMSQICVRRL